MKKNSISLFIGKSFDGMSSLIDNKIPPPIQILLEREGML